MALLQDKKERPVSQDSIFNVRAAAEPSSDCCVEACQKQKLPELARLVGKTSVKEVGVVGTRQFTNIAHSDTKSTNNPEMMNQLILHDFHL